MRNDVPSYFLSELKPAPRAFGSPTLWDAIGDLPSLVAGEGIEERDYDLGRRKDFVAERGEAATHYLKNVLEIAEAAKLSAHRSRPHNERDLRDFDRLREGETADQAIARGEKMEFPYDRSVFLDRYTRQHRERLCSTIVAHLAKDGLMFIHPTQRRTLTPREAARVQSFPDWFRFPVARTHQFRIIGNAVPPLVAEAVGCQIKEFLVTPSSNPARIETNSRMQKHARAGDRYADGANSPSCRWQTATTSPNSTVAAFARCPRNNSFMAGAPCSFSFLNCIRITPSITGVAMNKSVLTS